MFGGNPGGKEGRVRLGDFWRLVLVRPSEAALERHCRFTIREGRFAGLARRSPMDALGYLQTDIADCVDHGQPDEEQRFQLLAGQVGMMIILVILMIMTMMMMMIMMINPMEL